MSYKHKALRTLAAVLLLPPALAALPGSAALQASAAAASPAPAAVARATADRLAAADLDAVVATFSERLKATLPKEKLAAVWASLGPTYGKLVAVGTAEPTPGGPLTPVRVPLTFEKGKLDLLVAVDAAGRLEGLVLKPPVTVAGPPPYAVSGTFREEPASVGSGAVVLGATLARPVSGGPAPAVVLVHGSGPHDRDETVGGVKVFRDLAQGLASRGVAVLRYEKRTMARPELFANVAPTLENEVVEDAVAAVRLLLATPGVDTRRVYVLGHSLGGSLAPRIAKAEPRVAGIVSLAGATRPPWTLIAEQADHLLSVGTVDAATAALLKAEAELVARIARGETADPGKPVQGVPVSYWLSWGAVKAAEEAAALGKPVLALRGSRDYQVGAADQALWEKALAGKTGSTARTLPGLNHLFVTGEGTPGPAEYARPGHVAIEVVDAVAGFVGAPGR